VGHSLCHLFACYEQLRELHLRKSTMNSPLFSELAKVFVPSETPGHLDEESVPFQGFGLRLQTIRHQWQLSLRDVEERSLRLAQQWGNPSYRISASWLARVEHDGHELAVNKLIVLARIYGTPVEELLRPIHPDNVRPMLLEEAQVPNVTMLLTEEPAEEQPTLLLTNESRPEVTPEKTALISGENGHIQAPYKRGIIGRRDLTLDPMITAGSIVQIDTRKRTIGRRKDWGHEFRRPIYFLMTRDAYACGWCELDKDSEWLTLTPHPLSPALSSRWRYRKEVECIGRVILVAMRLPE
jgi:transcriptional regulator with XRE-family HTH domain